MAAETGLAITVCHFPPGTSKWNKVEHRLFSHITLNWRGRPLTSHEVVVKTIAATRTGLRVAAELDTGSYPLGVSVSASRMQTLPIKPHAWCGTWNYTINPADNADRQAHDPALARSQVLELLSTPALTGMTSQELEELAAHLVPGRAVQTAQRRYAQRGGPRRNAAGAGGRSLLTDTDRVLITAIYLRQHCSQQVLSELLEISPNAIGQAIADTRQLLNELGRTISPTTLRFPTARALSDFLTTGATTSTMRTRLPDLLSDPSLIGMSRPELARLIQRLAVHQAHQTEQRLYRRRGGERLPGARRGVFTQKITDAERVLATILHQREVCSQQVLAELFEVTAHTMSVALTQVRPLLEQDGYAATPAHSQYPTAAALLDAVAPPNATSGASNSPC